MFASSGDDPQLALALDADHGKDKEAGDKPKGDKPKGKDADKPKGELPPTGG